MNSLEHEASWWGDCSNTYAEETKHISYASRMGLETIVTVEGHWPAWNLAGKSVIDFGGGPVSMLLKCVNARVRTVIDPCPYPEWVRARYEAAGIALVRIRGEDVTPKNFDEAWIYNVLQHTDDPEMVVMNARAAAKTLRIFEWVDIGVDDKHPHTLTRKDLENWCGGKGKIEKWVNREWGEIEEHHKGNTAWYGWSFHDPPKGG